MSGGARGEAVPARDAAGDDPAAATRPDSGDSLTLARRIAELVDDKKGEDIVCLDVRELVGYTDYFVIATARNERQAKAIHDEIHLRLKQERGLLPARVEGERESRWILADYVDCVVHVFVPELRERYRLERLWGEAPSVELGPEGEASSP